MSVDSFLTQGNDINEANWTAHNRALTIGAAFVREGFEITDGGGLNATVGDGKALVNGVCVQSDANQTVVVADNDGSYIWLEPDGTLSDETAGADPGDSLNLGLVLASGGSIDSVIYRRNIGLDPDGTRNVNSQNIFIYKVADESLTNDTSEQNDDELQFDVLDGQVWDVTAMLHVNQQGMVADFKCRFASNGHDGSRFHLGNLGFGGAIHGEFVAEGGSLRTEMQTGDNFVFLRATIHPTINGTLVLQWAQGTSNTQTTVKAGSVLFARRLTG